MEDFKDFLVALHKNVVPFDNEQLEIRASIREVCMLSMTACQGVKQQWQVTSWE